jgi:hypothetical protein
MAPARFSGVTSWGGTTVTVASGGFGFKTDVDVDTNGDVAFWWAPASGTPSRAAFFWSGGAPTPVTIPTLLAIQGVRVSNGSVIVHQHSIANQRGNSARWTASGTEILDPTTTSPLVLGIHRPDRDYRQAGDWTAYTRTQGTNLVAWTRSPSGAHALASARSGTTLRLAGLSEDGEIAVDADGVRSLSRAGGTLPTPPLEIGSVNGFTRRLGQRWHVVLGRDVFRVETGDLPDGGAGDGGAPSDGGPPDTGPALDAGAPPGPGADAGVVDGGAPAGDASDDPTAPDEPGGCAQTRTTGASAASPIPFVALFVAHRRRQSRRRDAERGRLKGTTPRASPGEG